MGTCQRLRIDPLASLRGEQEGTGAPTSAACRVAEALPTDGGRPSLGWGELPRADSNMLAQGLAAAEVGRGGPDLSRADSRYAAAAVSDFPCFPKAVPSA